ncbi:MAG: acyl-ACP thioesterase [Candidatus Aminicenantes bacterium]|nr:acyl-ACP thioesterase [Candidatus Aminicenantes bacterium]
MSEFEHVKRFAVRAVDLDLSGRLQPVIAVDYLLEAAADHAAALKVGVIDLFGKGLTWVLSRLHVRFARYPRWGEAVTLRTWPSAQLPLYALREFEIADAAGPAIQATSSWIVIDLKTKRPVKLTDHFPLYPLRPARAVADDFPPLPAPTRADLGREYPVFFSDLDINRHVTSTVYIQRALETVPEDVLFNARPSSIEVNYRSEAFYGDGIVVETARLAEADPPAFLHRLSRASDGREFTLLRTAWARPPRPAKA